MEESSGGTSSDKPDTKPEEQNLIVALRIRPMNEDEIIAGATPVAHRVDDNMVVLMDPTDDPDDILRVNRSREKQYVFDVSFDGSATQKEVYESTTKFLIPSVVNGFNATVFAYGATGAGKTYTMLGTAEERGIMARTLNDLFMEMDKTREDMAYKVTVSFLEIYNEMIRDLLRPSSGVLDLREDAKGVQVAGISKFQANSSREIMDILFKGNKQRTQEPTTANKTSSRSHAVLQITVRQKSRVVDDTHQEVRVGKLFLIDLAGSERAANTQNRGKRMVEGAHINRSLLALGNCINALSDKNAHKYVNYRDSKLTRLLKDALGGNCKTVMIATISPASIHFEESRNTLLYADRAKNIKTKVRRNVMDVSYHIAQYSNIIAELRVEIKRLRSKLDNKTERISSMQSKFDLMHDTHYGDAEKLKEQLVQMFSHQMALRRQLMELDNKRMEIALEDSKNNFVIQKWDREKAVARRRGSDVDQNKYQDVAKELEMMGESSEEPDEVLQAREDMLSLNQQEGRLVEQREQLERQLGTVQDNIAKVEMKIPNLQSTADQQEILQLLCKIHELEMENIHMQSSCLLRSMDIRQREMAIEQYKQHHSLADELILQQRHLMDRNNITMSKDLEELYELYQQEGNQIIELQFTLPDIHNYKNSSATNLSHKLQETESISEVDDSSSTVNLPKIFVPYGGANSVARKNLLKKSSLHINKLEKQDSLFSPRPQAFDDAQVTENRESLSPPFVPVISKNSRQKSILTLSSRSTVTTPSPPGNQISPPHSPIFSGRLKEERTHISVNTRNIAALAAKRKSKQTSSQDPSFFMTQQPEYSQKPALTQSRLAQHDERYSSNSLNPLQNDNDMFSNESEPITRKTPLRKQNIYRHVPMKKKALTLKKKAAEPKDVKPNYQQMTPEEFFKKLSKISPKKHHQSPTSVNGEALKHKSKVPLPVHRGQPRSRIPPLREAHIRDSQNNGEVSERSDPSEKLGPKNPKKPLPSIPTYRKGDISITGQGLY